MLKYKKVMLTYGAVSSVDLQTKKDFAYDRKLKCP